MGPDPGDPHGGRCGVSPARPGGDRQVTGVVMTTQRTLHSVGYTTGNKNWLSWNPFLSLFGMEGSAPLPPHSPRGFPRGAQSCSRGARGGEGLLGSSGGLGQDTWGRSALPWEGHCGLSPRSHSIP